MQKPFIGRLTSVYFRLYILGQFDDRAAVGNSNNAFGSPGIESSLIKEQQTIRPHLLIIYGTIS